MVSKGAASVDECGSGGSGGAGALKKGPWTSGEDAILIDYVKKHGEGNWNAVQKHTGLMRCGKSCRLRWANHLRPDLRKDAFSKEEEQKIIELHAKMGNKWARMAAQMPGRTDNEIKNFWNTRLKRRQRAGLPVYPSDVCVQTLSDCQQQQNLANLNDNDGRINDILHTDYDCPDVFFDNLKDYQDPLSYGPGLPSIYGTDILSPPPLSFHNYDTSRFCPTKRPCQSDSFIPDFHGRVANGLSSFDVVPNISCEKIHQVHGPGLQSDPHLNKCIALPFCCSASGSHSHLGGNFSASKRLRKSVKLELPSFQYSEPETSGWGISFPSPLEVTNSYIRSSPKPLQSASTSWNSGLLEEVIHGPHVKNQLPEKILKFSVTPADVVDHSTLEIKKECHISGDPVSPLVRSASSVFGEYIPINESCMDESQPIKAYSEADVGEVIKFQPDTSLDSSCDFEKDLEALLAEGVDEKSVAALTEELSEEWGLTSCSWNNMPAADEMPENH